MDLTTMNMQSIIYVFIYITTKIPPFLNDLSLSKWACSFSYQNHFNVLFFSERSSLLPDDTFICIKVIIFRTKGPTEFGYVTQIIFTSNRKFQSGEYLILSYRKCNGTMNWFIMLSTWDTKIDSRHMNAVYMRY